MTGKVVVPEGAIELVCGISQLVIGYMKDGKKFILNGLELDGLNFYPEDGMPTGGESGEEYDTPEFKEKYGIPAEMWRHHHGCNDSIEEGYVLYTDGTFVEDPAIQLATDSDEWAAEQFGGDLPKDWPEGWKSTVISGGRLWAEVWYAADLDQ
jgi:hypothetical protein